MKVLLENLLRNEDGRTVKKEDIQAIAHWLSAQTGASGDAASTRLLAAHAVREHEEVLAHFRRPEL